MRNLISSVSVVSVLNVSLIVISYFELFSYIRKVLVV